MTIPAILHQLGFEPKEAAVYVATLEIGMAPISVIARKAKLKRSTTYEILKKLSEKGVAEFFVKKSTRYYAVIPPKALLARFESSVEQLKEALPELLAISNQIVDKPRITFYEGKEDLKRLYVDALTAKKGDILNYFHPEAAVEYFGWDWMKKEMVEKLPAVGRVRVIMPDTPLARKFIQNRESPKRMQRIITKTGYFFKNEVGIYDNKVMVFSFEEDFAFLIESSLVADTQRAIFNLAWESASLRGADQ